jgi:hypothetical protein
MRVDYAVSTRPEAHARPVAVWALADRAAAVRWLAEHPLPTLPPPPADQPSLFGYAPQGLPD